MQPQALLRVLREVTHITLLAPAFAVAGFTIAYWFGYLRQNA